MVSYYHHKKALLKNPFENSFAEFIRHPKYGLESCFQHLESWKARSTVVIYYEAMKIDAMVEMQRMLRALNISVEDDVVKKAVERSSISKLQTIQKERGHATEAVVQSDFVLARKGETGQWRSFFSEKDLSYFTEIQSRYSDSLGSSIQ